MAKRAPWHSARPGERVYHDNDRCLDGDTIEHYWIRHTSDGRPLCDQCAWLNAVDEHDIR
jgi:hypothetical protein